MATIKITVPMNASIEAKRDWNPEVSSILDAGNDVEFVNEDGIPVNVPFIGLMAGTDGVVKSKTVTGEITTQTLAASGYHQIWVNKIFAVSDNSLGIHVKLV